MNNNKQAFRNLFSFIKEKYIPSKYNKIYYDTKQVNDLTKEKYTSSEYDEIYYDTEQAIRDLTFDNDSIDFFIRENILLNYSDIVPRKPFKEYLEYNKFYHGKEKIVQLFTRLFFEEIKYSYDYFKQVQFVFFIGNKGFYKRYNCFENKNLDYCLIKEFFKDLKLDKPTTQVRLKTTKYKKIIIFYFKKTIVYIRKNIDLYSQNLIAKEINRMEIFRLEYNFEFPNEYINELNKVISNFKSINLKEEENKKLIPIKNSKKHINQMIKGLTYILKKHNEKNNVSAEELKNTSKKIITRPVVHYKYRLKKLFIA